MSDATTQPAASTSAPAPAPVAPSPGTPEHRAAMISAYDAQFAPAPKPQEATAAIPAPAESDPNAPAPKLTDEAPAEVVQTEGVQTEEKSEESKDAAAPTVNEALVAEFATGFNAEKLPDTLVDALVKLGFPKELVEQHHANHRAGQAALVSAQTQSLYQAAGGEARFKAMVAWGQKNLTAEQRQFYDTQLNGPTAAEAIAVLQQRMNAGKDPSIALGNATASGTMVGFKSQSEVTAAMSDPRYWTDEAYHNSVKSRLAVSRY